MNSISDKIETLVQTENRIQKRLVRLNAKLDTLQNEKAVLEQQLASAQNQIQTLQSALQIMENPEPLATNSFYQRVFNSKVNQLVMKVLKSHPDKAYLTKELVAEMLILDNQSNTKITEQHIKSARQPLNTLNKKGVITRTEITPMQIYWQWKTKSEVA